MKKTLTCVAIATLALCGCSSRRTPISPALVPPPPAQAKQAPPERRVVDEGPSLSKDAQEALRLYFDRQHTVTTRKGVTYVTYTGESVAVYGKLFYVTDIALGQGERIVSMIAGDRVRWCIEATDAANVPHVSVKPCSDGPDMHTNLVVYTTQRVYHLTLRVHPAKYVPQVQFVFPRREFDE